MAKERPCKENQWLCEVHHYLMPDGHCSCEEEKAKAYKRYLRKRTREFQKAAGAKYET